MHSSPLALLASQVANFQKRFKTIPSLLEVDHLTVAGDVSFGRNVVLRGTVIIVANDGQAIELPDGTTLENKLVSGAFWLLPPHLFFPAFFAEPLLILSSSLSYFPPYANRFPQAHRPLNPLSSLLAERRKKHHIVSLLLFLPPSFHFWFTLIRTQICFRLDKLLVPSAAILQS
jgi:hypothetical protein